MPPEIIDLLRFVRDTDAPDHMLPALKRMFSAATMRIALSNGWLQQQVWQSRQSGWIDLTSKGEAYLCDHVRERVSRLTETNGERH